MLHVLVFVTLSTYRNLFVFFSVYFLISRECMIVHEEYVLSRSLSRLNWTFRASRENYTHKKFMSLFEGLICKHYSYTRWRDLSLCFYLFIPMYVTKIFNAIVFLKKRYVYLLVFFYNTLREKVSRFYGYLQFCIIIFNIKEWCTELKRDPMKNIIKEFSIERENNFL